ncbi:MAG: polyphosphate polymerase domain-containing protein [Clostridia bacterium]|nr:polyphosphate polymerase domain-containing protein [Clostridia bacterium]
MKTAVSADKLNLLKYYKFIIDCRENKTEKKAADTRPVEDPILSMSRYELKFILSREQTERIRKRLEGHMQADRYGLTTISSLYYDTPDRRLIRSSVENTGFKEKIRLRSYGLATRQSPVFLELKRKADGIVYKRRICATIPLVEKFFDRENGICSGGQIDRELTAFRDHYETLVPSCLIIYDRTAYFEPDGDLRLTIDGDPRYRVEDLRLDHSTEGISLLPEGSTVLEIKVQSAIPLWLTSILSEEHIYKCSFSKYGEVYKQQLLKAN